MVSMERWPRPDEPVWRIQAMPEDAFRALVAAMRAAQRAYFKDRTKENLIASKEAEKAVDAALKELGL